MLCQMIAKEGVKLHRPCLMWDTLGVPRACADSEWGHEARVIPEHVGTSPWHRGVANSDTRSGLEDSITAFASCHKSM